MNPSPCAVALLNKLRGVKGKANGEGWVAFCPSHDDGKERGLSIMESSGKVVLHCFAGCPPDAIVTSIGLSMQDLFEDTRHSLPPKEATKGGRAVSSFVLPDGSVAEHWRLDAPDGKRMWWTRNRKNGLDGYPVKDIPLYGFDSIGAIVPVLVVEGEAPRDAVLLVIKSMQYAVVATVCGAATIPSAISLGVLLGHYVVLWPDNDDPGQQHMNRIAYWLSSRGEIPFIVQVEALPPKGDAADAVKLQLDIPELLMAALPYNGGVLPEEDAAGRGFSTYF